MSYIQYKVQKGDTLQRIAHFYGVDTYKLAYINSLKPPYVIDELVQEKNKISNIKYINDLILVPTDDLTDSVVSQSVNDSEDEAFGKDLKTLATIDINSFFNLESSIQITEDYSGDFSVANGIENLRQALTNRLATQKGELILHPEYGSNLLDLVGKPATPSNLTKIKLEVIETLKSDERVSDVKNCRVSNENRITKVTCDVVTKELLLSFSLNTVAKN